MSSGYKNHLSLKPTAYAIKHFANRLIDYQTTKHAIYFPDDKLLPSDLIQEIALWNKKALENGTLYKEAIS